MGNGVLNTLFDDFEDFEKFLANTQILQVQLKLNNSTAISYINNMGLVSQIV